MNKVATMSRDELRGWLVGRAAFYLDKSPETIDPQVELELYGMDSLLAMGIISDIEDYLQVEIDMEQAPRLRTVDGLADYLLERGV